MGEVSLQKSFPLVAVCAAARNFCRTDYTDRDLDIMTPSAQWAAAVKMTHSGIYGRCRKNSFEGKLHP